MNQTLSLHTDQPLVCFNVYGMPYALRVVEQLNGMGGKECGGERSPWPPPVENREVQTVLTYGP